MCHADVLFSHLRALNWLSYFGKYSSEVIYSCAIKYGKHNLCLTKNYKECYQKANFSMVKTKYDSSKLCNFEKYIYLWGLTGVQRLL